MLSNHPTSLAAEDRGGISFDAQTGDAIKTISEPLVQQLADIAAAPV